MVAIPFPPGTGPLVVWYAHRTPRRALGAARRSKFAPGFKPMLHTACRTLHGACTPHIAHCQCMRNTLSLACSIVGTLRPVFLVPSPAPRSRVPIGTVSTQIASRAGMRCSPIGAGGARAHCRLATVPLVRTVRAIISNQRHRPRRSQHGRHTRVLVRAARTLVGGIVCAR
jgi:hypothetical protein